MDVLCCLLFGLLSDDDDKTKGQAKIQEQEEKQIRGSIRFNLAGNSPRHIYFYRLPPTYCPQPDMLLMYACKQDTTRRWAVR